MLKRARNALSWQVSQQLHQSAGLCSIQQDIGKNQKHKAPAGPLQGIKVLDLGQVVAGNFCGAVLGYFGADVIKVEPPGAGDALRSLRMADKSGTSLWWRSYGRNRRCLTLDLRQEVGRDICRQLADRADVLVENFRPGVMEKWGLGPKVAVALKQKIRSRVMKEQNPGAAVMAVGNLAGSWPEDLKPELVYARISGYGQTGPKASLPGYASVCEAYGGFRHLNGFADRPPVRPNISLGDTLAGLHAALGISMALLHRQTHNKQVPGQVVDASISESMFNMLEGCIPELVYHGHDRPPSGSTISGVVPSATLETLDGRWIIIGGNGDSIYSRLMAAVGRPDMGAQNPNYATNSQRCQREMEIYQVLGDWVKSHTLDEVMAAMKEARVPAGPILSTADIYKEQQFQQRDMFETATAPEGEEEYTLPAMLPVMVGTPGGTRWAGPTLGQHTSEILAELGKDPKEVNKLKDAKVV